MPTEKKSNLLQRAPGSAATLESEEVEHQQVATSERVSNTELRRAIANPRSASPDAILSLQARYGNQAVQRMVGGRQRGKAFHGISKDRNDEEAIFARLRNQKFRVLFMSYSKNEFSLENLEGLLEIQEYRVNPNLPRAKRLYNWYVAPKSPNELNLPAAIVRDTNTALQQDIIQGTASKTLFDKVIDGVMVNILDTWSRFRVSQDFQDWQEQNPHF